MTHVSTPLDVALFAAATDCLRRSQGKQVREGILESIQDGRRVTLDFGRVAALSFAFVAGVFAGLPHAFAEFIDPPVNADPEVLALVKNVCEHLPLGSQWMDGHEAAPHVVERVNPFMADPTETDEPPVQLRA
ncbi:MAG: STAS-like domain-containing protein [Acidiferrobacterales bacterium]